MLYSLYTNEQIPSSDSSSIFIRSQFLSLLLAHFWIVSLLSIQVTRHLCTAAGYEHKRWTTHTKESFLSISTAEYRHKSHMNQQQFWFENLKKRYPNYKLLLDELKAYSLRISNHLLFLQNVDRRAACHTTLIQFLRSVYVDS